jgi:rare lipoprotein A
LIAGVLAALPGAATSQAPPASSRDAAAPSSNAAAAAATPSGAAEDTGKLAWYGKKFSGRRTASGERYDPGAMTMAHKSLPFGTIVDVTNLSNGRKARLRVNDRGPAQADRVGDVSAAAARELGMVRAGVIDASIVVVREPNRKAG